MFCLFIMLCALTRILASEQAWSHFGTNEYLLDGQRSVHSYNDATRKCADWDATLIVMKTPEVYEFIKNLSQSTTVPEIPYSYYIGIFRTSRNPKLRWLDVSDVDAGFTKWATGEPRQGTGLNAVVMGRRDAQEGGLNWRLTDGKYDDLSHTRVACQRPSRVPTERPPTFPLHEEEVITTTTRKIATISSPDLVELEVQADRFSNLRQTRSPVQTPAASGGGGATIALIVVAAIIAVSTVVLMYVWYLRWKKVATKADDEEEARIENSEDEKEPSVAADSSQPQTSSAKEVPLFAKRKPSKPATSSSIFLQARSTLLVVTNSMIRRFSAVSTYFDARAAQSNAAPNRNKPRRNRKN